MHTDKGNQMMRNSMLGALFGGGLALAVFGLWYYAAASLDLPEPQPPADEGQAPAQSADELHILFVIVPTLVGVCCGAMLGRLAGVFVIYRYLKLLASALALYFLAAFVCAGVLVASTTLSEAADGQSGALLFLSQTLQGGLFGALVLSPVCVPLLLLLVFALERLTQPVRTN